MNGSPRPTIVRTRAVTAAVAVLALVLLLPAAIAHAGVGASAVPSFPPVVTVGQAGLPATIEVRNTNNDANLGDTNTVCNFGDGFPCPAGDQGISLIPSCAGLGAFSACATADPGVFRISDTAQGAAGTACAGVVFNVGLADPANGQVRFTPQGGAHVTLPGAGSVCRIDFTFGVLRAPVGDQNPSAPGVQTVQVTDNTQYAGTLTASARGTSFGVTVNRATPLIATVASPPVPVGGQLTDTATVTGLVNPSGGTVDFRLYGPDDETCARPPVFESLAVPLGADGRATSAPFTPARGGEYRWRAFYSGDANNNAVAGGCNEANENVTVTAPPTITVQTERRSGPCLVTRFTMRVRVAAAGLRKVQVKLDGKTIKRTKQGALHAPRAHPRAPQRAPRAQGDRHRGRRAQHAQRVVPPLRRTAAPALRRQPLAAGRPRRPPRPYRGGRPPGRRRRGGHVAGVVAPARRPRVGVRPGELEAALRTARRIGPRHVPARAAVIARVALVVVAQLEEPDQPDDERADVEDAQPDHEDPSLQRHPAQA